MPEYEPRATHRRADRVSSASTSHDRWRRRRGVFPRLSGVTNDFFIVIDRRERPARDGGRLRAERTNDRSIKIAFSRSRSRRSLFVALSVEKIGARVDRRTCESDRRRATPRARMGLDARLRRRHRRRRRLHRRRRARRRRRVDDSDEASFASDDDARTPTRTRTRRGRMMMMMDAAR